METRTEPVELQFVRECVLLGRRWRSRVDEVFRPHGLTLARSTVLYWLDELPGLVTQRELADTVGIEGPTLVRQLHALEAQGLVERVAMPGDRRAKGIRLTDAALPIIAQIRTLSEELATEVFVKLDKRRLPGVTRLLGEARAALD